MTSKLNVVNQDSVDAVRALITTGDVDLAATRSGFKATYNRPTTLTDDDLVVVIASQDDAYGDDDIFNRILAAEQGRDLCWEGEQLVPEAQSAG